jgi:hypothetical protein
MDKLKMIQIITKDLEELKFLTEEVTDIEGDASLIIDLAHSKAKLLCQEIELLRELLVPQKKAKDDDEEELADEEENEIMDPEQAEAEPELEILNFEEAEESDDDDPEEIAEKEPEEKEDPEIEEADESDDDSDEITEEEPEEDDVPETENEEKELESEEEEIEEEDFVEEESDFVEEQEEEDLVEEDDDELEENTIEEEVKGEEEKIVYEDDEEEEEDLTEEVEKGEENELVIESKRIQFTELDSEPGPEYREINIDDPDDDDLETIQFEPHKSPADRPAMVEIPKPENQSQEKSVVGETFQKERSLNDAMGENKTSESKLTNGPISSLRAAIGLNDRFLFIREIFDNNTEKYNTVIENLDKLETIQQAVEYLKANLSLQKNETSMKFVDLLKRRFSK